MRVTNPVQFGATYKLTAENTPAGKAFIDGAFRDLQSLTDGINLPYQQIFVGRNKRGPEEQPFILVAEESRYDHERKTNQEKIMSMIHWIINGLRGNIERDKVKTGLMINPHPLSGKRQIVEDGVCILEFDPQDLQGNSGVTAYKFRKMESTGAYVLMETRGRQA